MAGSSGAELEQLSFGSLQVVGGDVDTDGREPGAGPVRAAGIDEMIHVVEDWFTCAGVPESDPNAELVASVVDSIVSDRSLVRVEQLVDVVGCSTRQLQRLFADYIGVSPKWTLRRYRMQEAAARASDREPVNWSELGHELGYSDQPHFIRDFTATLGITPHGYRMALNQSSEARPSDNESTTQ